MSDINWTPGDIASACANDNAAGLKPTLYITTEKEVAAIPAATQLVVSGAITMSAADIPNGILEAGTFKKWGTTLEPAKYTYTAESGGDRDSTAIPHTLTVALPKATAARIWAARAGCSHIVIFTDKQGIRRIMGEKENGCSMTWGVTINENSNQQNIVFTFDAGRPLYEYSGAIPV